MSSLRLVRVLPAAGLLALGGFLSASGPVSAGEPAATGCPAAYDRLSVTQLESEGPYKVPRRLDEAGNRDGYVCGKPVQDQAAENYCDGPCPAQLYNFTENDRTPEHHG